MASVGRKAIVPEPAVPAAWMTTSIEPHRDRASAKAWASLDRLGHIGLKAEQAVAERLEHVRSLGPARDQGNSMTALDEPDGQCDADVTQATRDHVSLGVLWGRVRCHDVAETSRPTMPASERPPVGQLAGGSRRRCVARPSRRWRLRACR